MDEINELYISNDNSRIIFEMLTSECWWMMSSQTNST